MRVSVPATLFITLSAHRYLSHALPLGFHPRSHAPRALDYPVVNIADPEVEAPDLAPGDDDENTDAHDVVTRTVTRGSETPTGHLRTPSPSPTESCITGGIVPIVGVKESGGAVRSTTTTYTTQSSLKTPVPHPTPSPSASSASSARPAGAGHKTRPTSGASVSEATPSPDSVPSLGVPAHSRNGTSPVITSSSAVETPSEESSPSTGREGSWAPPVVKLHPEPEPEPEVEPTTSAAIWNTDPTPVPSREWDETPATVPTIQSPLSTGSSTAAGNYEPFDASNHEDYGASDHEPYDPSNRGGRLSWNGTTPYRFRRST